MMSHDKNAGVEAVILAAGKGTRMKSDLAKVLHNLAGNSLLAHVLGTVREAHIHRTIVVIGHQADRVKEICREFSVEWVIQEPQLGTGHALQVVAPHLTRDGYTLVLNGDVPLLEANTIDDLLTTTMDKRLAATVLTCVVPDAGAYGRILKDSEGRLSRIVEARDATQEELAIGEFNTGVYCFHTQPLLEALSELTNDNDQGEYYLTDTIAHLVVAGESVGAVVCQDPQEVIGINTVAELQAAEKLYFIRRP